MDCTCRFELCNLKVWTGFPWVNFNPTVWFDTVPQGAGAVRSAKRLYEPCLKDGNVGSTSYVVDVQVLTI